MSVTSLPPSCLPIKTTRRRGGESQPLCLLSRGKRAINDAAIKPKTPPERASHRAAFLYPVPRKILAGTKTKQTALLLKRRCQPSEGPGDLDARQLHRFDLNIKQLHLLPVGFLPFHVFFFPPYLTACKSILWFYACAPNARTATRRLLSIHQKILICLIGSVTLEAGGAEEDWVFTKQLEPSETGPSQTKPLQETSAFSATLQQLEAGLVFHLNKSPLFLSLATKFLAIFFF